MPSKLGSGFAHSGESHYLRGPKRAFWDAMNPAPIILYLHGYTGSGLATAVNVNEAILIRHLGLKAAVLSSDWGWDTFGNDTGIARVHEGLANIRSSFNVDDEPIVLVGMSMGAGLALAYALAYPENVRAVAGLIPNLDLNDIVVNNRAGAAAVVNAAFGGAYNDAVHGPEHNPVRFADDLPIDMPIHLWTSTTDTLTIPSTADEFVDAREQTNRTSLGAVGHSTVSIAGFEDDIADWCFAQLGV